MDVSKSHAECNVAHFSGSKMEIWQCTFLKKVIQEKRLVLLRSTNGGATSALCMGFAARKRRNAETASFRALRIL